MSAPTAAALAQSDGTPKRPRGDDHTDEEPAAKRVLLDDLNDSESQITDYASTVEIWKNLAPHRLADPKKATIAEPYLARIQTMLNAYSSAVSAQEHGLESFSLKADKEPIKVQFILEYGSNAEWIAFKFGLQDDAARDKYKPLRCLLHGRARKRKEMAHKKLCGMLLYKTE